MQRGQLWCCDVCPLFFKAFQVVLGSWNPEFTICPFRARIWPFQAPKTLRFQGKMAIFEAKNTIKQGKNAKRTNGTHFMCVHPLPSAAIGQIWGVIARYPAIPEKHRCDRYSYTL